MSGATSPEPRFDPTVCQQCGATATTPYPRPTCTVPADPRDAAALFEDAELDALRGDDTGWRLCGRCDRQRHRGSPGGRR